MSCFPKTRNILNHPKYDLKKVLEASLTFVS